MMNTFPGRCPTQNLNRLHHIDDPSISTPQMAHSFAEISGHSQIQRPQSSSVMATVLTAHTCVPWQPWSTNTAITFYYSTFVGMEKVKVLPQAAAMPKYATWKPR